MRDQQQQKKKVREIRSGCNPNDQEVWPSPMILTLSLLLLRYISTCILLTVLLVILVPFVPSKIPSKTALTSTTTATTARTSPASERTSCNATKSDEEEKYYYLQKLQQLQQQEVTYVTFGLASGHVLLSDPPSNGHVGNNYRDIGKNITKILNDFFEHGYDKRVRPKYGGKRSNVLIFLSFLSFYSCLRSCLLNFTRSLTYPFFTTQDNEWRKEKQSTNSSTTKFFSLLSFIQKQKQNKKKKMKKKEKEKKKEK